LVPQAQATLLLLKVELMTPTSVGFSPLPMPKMMRQGNHDDLFS